jgi:hypothetical protein
MMKFSLTSLLGRLIASMLTIETVPSELDSWTVVTTCNAAAVSEYVGKQFDVLTLQAILRSAGTDTFRLLRPGELHTADSPPNRLNIILGATGDIEAITCS